jgi:predicted nucleic acid-binding protein
MFLSGVEDGSSVFIDANVFVYHFSMQSVYNSSCSTFLERIERGAIKGITSTFVVQEATVQR